MPIKERELLRAMGRVIGRIEVDRDAPRAPVPPTLMSLDDPQGECVHHLIQLGAASPRSRSARSSAATPARRPRSSRGRAVACAWDRPPTGRRRWHQGNRTRSRTPVARRGPAASARRASRRGHPSGSPSGPRSDRGGRRPLSAESRRRPNSRGPIEAGDQKPIEQVGKESSLWLGMCRRAGG